MQAKVGQKGKPGKAPSLGQPRMGDHRSLEPDKAEKVRPPSRQAMIAMGSK